MPPNLKSDERVPAIMLLHDACDDPLAAVYRQGWIATAIQAHFAIIAPEAGLQSRSRNIGGFFNARVWNAGSANAAAWADKEFLDAVAIDAQKRLPLDPGRIYLAGFGEGGAMAMDALKNNVDPFAAFASVAGPLYASPKRAMARPLLLLYGLADPTNPPDGGATYTPWAGAEERAPLAQHIGLWRDQLGCSKRPDVNPIDEVIAREIWTICREHAALQVIWVAGLGRQWPGTGAGPLPRRVAGPPNDALFAPWEIWRFFEDRKLPSAH